MPDDPNIQMRKREHVEIVLNQPEVERGASGFESIRLQHRALPELNFADLDSSLDFFGYRLSLPLLISSMTGGSDDFLKRINRHLAEAAQHCRIAMAVGSQRAMIVDPAAADSFDIRRYAPDVPLFANLGAVQLNYGFGIDEARRAVDLLEADALILHLNPLQELIQPEGQANFSGLAEKIGQLAGQLTVPVILKEIGCGLSAADIELGLQAGIRYFDLAGRGGTSWSRIEAQRSDNTLGMTFQDWGLTTVESLRQAQPYQSQATFFASGGLRNGIDMVKSVILGGRVCGLAAPFLKPATESTAAVVALIERLKREFQTTQFLLGAQNIDALFLNSDLIANS